MFRKIPHPQPIPSDDERVTLSDRERALIRAEYDALIHGFGTARML